MEIKNLPVYERGWWGRGRDVEKTILNALERWQESTLSHLFPVPDRILFYCYDCGFPKYASEKMLMHGQRPRCPNCKERMNIYSSETLKKRRKELADITKAMLSRVLRLFSEAAEPCGGATKWALLTNGVLEVSSNCAKFWFDPRPILRPNIVAVLYTCEGYEIGKILERSVEELNVWLFYTIKRYPVDCR
ncbi:MAG: hypothetical protein ACO2PN_13805 [Pyrobaculum sp.]|jgi:hypothetical protein